MAKAKVGKKNPDYRLGEKILMVLVFGVADCIGAIGDAFDPISQKKKIDKDVEEIVDLEEEVDEAVGEETVEATEEKVEETKESTEETKKGEIVEVAEEEPKSIFTVVKDETAVGGKLNNVDINILMMQYADITSKLYIATIYNIIGAIDNDQLTGLMKDGDLIEDDRVKFVDSVYKLYTGKLFSKNAECPDFNMDTEKVAHLFNSIIYKDIVSTSPLIADITERTKEYVLEKNRKDKKIGADGSVIVPFIFSNNRSSVNYNIGAPKDVIEKLTAQYGQLLSHFKYNVTKLRTGMVQLDIDRGCGITSSYNIDTGVIFGQDYKFEVPTAKGTIWTNDIHLILNYLLDTNYICPEEAMKNTVIAQRELGDQELYYVFDTSNIGKQMLMMGINDMFSFEACLKVMREILTKHQLQDARLRIDKLRGNGDFVAISDNLCKSPLGEMNSTLVPGLTISVTGGFDYHIEIKDDNGVNQLSQDYHFNETELEFMYYESDSLDVVLQAQKEDKEPIKEQQF